MKKKTRASLLIASALVLLGTLAGAVIINVGWSGASTITKGQSATFVLNVGSFDPPIHYIVKITDANYNNAKTLKDVVYNDMHAQEYITITPIDYGNVGGVFHIVVSATDAVGQDYNNDLTLIVTQSAPVISNIPDAGIEQNTNHTINLSNYVTDADDPISSLAWTASGNSNVPVSIANGIATLIPKTGWTGSEAINFTVTDPSGASASDVMTLTVYPTGQLPSEAKAEKKEARRIQVDYFGDNYIKIANMGDRVEGLSIKVMIEDENAPSNIFNFDLDYNTVIYKELNTEGMKLGAYLAKVEVKADDFDEERYAVVEI